MKLLIVDDSNIIRSRIARISTSGALPECDIVGMARNGVEALLVCQRNRPDVITMDLTMPQMDGIECIRQIARQYPEVLILVVSALSDKSTAIRALREGAHGFLYKPFSDKELAAALLQLSQEVSV